MRGGVVGRSAREPTPSSYGKLRGRRKNKGRSPHATPPRDRRSQDLASRFWQDAFAASQLPTDPAVAAYPRSSRARRDCSTPLFPSTEHEAHHPVRCTGQNASHAEPGHHDVREERSTGPITRARAPRGGATSTTHTRDPGGSSNAPRSGTRSGPGGMGVPRAVRSRAPLPDASYTPLRRACLSTAPPSLPAELRARTRGPRPGSPSRAEPHRGAAALSQRARAPPWPGSRRSARERPRPRRRWPRGPRSCRSPFPFRRR